jgi:serine/threonine protein kinase
MESIGFENHRTICLELGDLKHLPHQFADSKQSFHQDRARMPNGSAGRSGSVIAAVKNATTQQTVEFVHRDLTPANVLLDWDCNIQTSHFGQSGSDGSSAACTLSAPPQYCALESSRNTVTTKVPFSRSG